MNILILEDTNTFVEEFVDILKNNNLFTDAHFFCLGDHFEKIDDTKDYQVIFIPNCKQKLEIRENRN